jgi:hypothetical protein
MAILGSQLLSLESIHYTSSQSCGHWEENILHPQDPSHRHPPYSTQAPRPALFRKVSLLLMALWMGGVGSGKRIGVDAIFGISHLESWQFLLFCKNCRCSIGELRNGRFDRDAVQRDFVPTETGLVAFVPWQTRNSVFIAMVGSQLGVHWQLVTLLPAGSSNVW